MYETFGITIGNDLEALMRARYAHPDDETMARIAEGVRKGMTIGAILGAGVTLSGGPLILSQSETLVKANTRAWGNGRKMALWLSTNYLFEEAFANTLQPDQAIKRTDEKLLASGAISLNTEAPWSPASRAYLTTFRLEPAHIPEPVLLSLRASSEAAGCRVTIGGVSKELGLLKRWTFRKARHVVRELIDTLT
jgi:hypothetical protein